MDFLRKAVCSIPPPPLPPTTSSTYRNAPWERNQPLANITPTNGLYDNGVHDNGVHGNNLHGNSRFSSGSQSEVPPLQGFLDDSNDLYTSECF